MALEESDTSYREKLLHHLSDESDKLIEDAEITKNESLNRWSALFWNKVTSIIGKRKAVNGQYDLQKFKDLEERCLAEYRYSNRRTLIHLREKLRDRDNRFVSSMSSSDEIFRTWRLHAGGEDEALLRHRNRLRESLVMDYRIEKRSIIETELHKEYEVFSMLDSLRYEDFCVGGRSCDTRCFT